MTDKEPNPKPKRLYRIIVFKSKVAALAEMERLYRAGIGVIAVFEQVQKRTTYHVGRYADAPLAKLPGWEKTQRKEDHPQEYIQYDTGSTSKQEIIDAIQKQFPKPLEVIDKAQK